jgi:hypothetical protein
MPSACNLRVRLRLSHTAKGREGAAKIIRGSGKLAAENYALVIPALEISSI